MKKLLALLILTSVSCAGLELDDRATTQHMALSDEISKRLASADAPTTGDLETTGPLPETPPVVPDLEPARPDVSPLSKRIVNISVRNEPLRNVLKIIADTAYLNLVMGPGVDPERTVTLTLNQLTARAALEATVSAVGYFYSLHGNVLEIRAIDTMTFEFGHPAVVTNYTMRLGGDILGGASSEGSSNLKGDIFLEGAGDKKAQNLWDTVEQSIETILGGSADTRTDGANYSINRVTGIIQVTAGRQKLDQVSLFLHRVRSSLNRQVMIEARILEVQLTDELKYGIDWTFLDDVDGIGRIGMGTFDPGNANRPGFSDLFETSESFFSLGLTGASFSALVQALQAQGNVSVLSNPRVRLMNGQSALLSVGRNVSFVSKVETTTTSTETIGSVSFTVETSSILSGIVIGLVPYINPNGTVSLTVTPIVSELLNLEDKSFGGADGVTVSLPTVDLREMSTTVRARSGELVVIGGLIDRKDMEDETGIPVLSSLPLLGPLFKNKVIHEERTELVLLLKPTVSGID